MKTTITAFIFSLFILVAAGCSSKATTTDEAAFNSSAGASQGSGDSGKVANANLGSSSSGMGR